MRPIFTRPFVRDYQRLPAIRQEQFDKQMELLLKNPRHPSLQARIVDTKRRIWKAKVNGGYRFTFQVRRDVAILRAIGAHGEMERPERW